MDSIFVGNTLKPSFLVEIIPKNKIINIYKQDKYSKDLEFYEKYALGNLILTSKYNEIYFEVPPKNYKKYYLFVPKLILKIKNKFVYISDKLKYLE
jgi:hypothetical protein